MAQPQRDSDRLPTLAGWVAFGLLAALTVAGMVRRLGDMPVVAVVAAAVAIAAGGVTVLAPFQIRFVPASVVAVAAVAVLGNGTASNVSWFVVCLLAAWWALTAPIPVVAGFWGGATLLLVLEFLLATSDPGWFAWIAGTAFSVISCLFGRRQHDLVVQLRQAQAGLALRAQAEERSRIARELHDVIAHSLTVSLMQISAARLAVRDDPQDAERALAEAERLNRSSLDEVRHTVGILHQPGSVDPTTPLPGSTDVLQLLDQFRSAGASLTAMIDGDLTTVPATAGLAVFRILQEALTNAAKHAPDCAIAVRLRVAEGSVGVEVDSAGPPQRGHGLGLSTMRERAESVGGRISAGPGGGGWLVRADLPVGSR